MKKLLLFCLLASVPAFGQAYSSSVTQNSPGNYGRPVPYATVIVCAVGDTAVPCVNKSVTYTDYTLSTQCTFNAGSGVLTGAGTSGTNCNNPGIADINGNFTIFVQPGQYTVCTFASSWLCQKISTGTNTPGISFSCPGALNGSLMATLTPTTSSCDPNMGTDFHGNGFAQSWKYLGPVNGFFGVIGGAPDPGTVPAYKLNANEVRALAPLTAPTPYYWRWPSTPCAVGQVWNVTGSTTDANGDRVTTYGCLTVSSGVSATATSPIVVTPSPGTGAFVISCPTCSTGSSLVAALNPSAPTATVTNAGSTDYKVAVFGCEDVSCTYHSALSAVKDIPNGNATINGTNPIKLTAYADTLYGYRYFGVCLTATAGTPATTGVIATGVGKQWTWTGQNGDGTNCATAYASNTTGLDQHCVGASAPSAVNVIPGAPCGVDAPPTTVNALSDEFSWGPPGSWVPGDSNDPQYTQFNWSTSTLTLTSGELIFSTPNATNQIRMFGVSSMPSAPWTAILKFLPHWGTNGIVQSGICLYDGTKLVQFESDSRATTGIALNNFTGFTTFSSSPAATAYLEYPSWLYMKVANDGTNLTYSWSFDGVGYNTLTSTLVGAWLGTITSVGPCQQSQGVPATMNIDYMRWQ